MRFALFTALTALTLIGSSSADLERRGRSCKAHADVAVNAAVAKTSHHKSSHHSKHHHKHHKSKHHKSKASHKVSHHSSTKSSSGKTSSSASADSAHTLVSLSSINAFHGEQGSSSAIMSWYQADTGRDSTNGHSWCGFPYNDASPLFAPSVGTMLKAAGGDYNKAISMFCGLEAKVTGPNGREALMILGDGFDDSWIRSPGSIDVMHDTFEKFLGSNTDDKNVVVTGVRWEFTGRRAKQYVAKGQGN